MQTYQTPILFLIFNRLETAQVVFDRIRQVQPRHLFIAADGPRKHVPGEEEKCKITRQLIDQIDWPCELQTLFRDENLGCGLAVSSAVSWFFNQVEYGIILEDDCLPDVSFFPFCSELLEKYKKDDDVFFISGTNLQNGLKRGSGSYYFSNHTITWGWASWKRAWNFFNYEIENVEQAFRSDLLKHVFQTKQEKKYWKKALVKSQKERKNIWDYQWFYATWLNKGMGITSNVNLIVNIGFQNTGVHTFLKDSRREVSRSDTLNFPLTHPDVKEINRKADYFAYKEAFSHSPKRFLRLIRENGILNVLKYSINKIRALSRMPRHH